MSAEIPAGITDKGTSETLEIILQQNSKTSLEDFLSKSLEDISNLSSWKKF